MASNIHTSRRAGKRPVVCQLLLILPFCLCIPGGCSLPPVKLSTPEPVKVDVNVRLDVYQHKDKEQQQNTESTEPADDTATLEQRRRNRMGDIQIFKNSRLVGENKDALLEIRDLPPGEYGDYVKQVVTAENDDRVTLMQRQADASGLELQAVQQERAKLWRNQSFRGEWIEVPQPSGDGFYWIQKGSEP